MESVLGAGMHVFVVSGTNVANIDGQLKARPKGPGSLFLCCNRGSEVFEVFGSGPVLMYRRTASPQEDRSLDRAAELTVQRLNAMGLEAKVVSSRLNRRKIDLIPIAAWADPKKADIVRLAEAVAGAAGGRRYCRSGRGGGSGRRLGQSGGADRCEDHERRQACRDRPDRQIGLGPVRRRLAGRAGDHRRSGIDRGGRVRPYRRRSGQRLADGGGGPRSGRGRLGRLGAGRRSPPVVHLGGGPSPFDKLLDEQLATSGCAPGAPDRP